MNYMIEKNAYPIERAHFDDAGIDIRTPEEFVLHAGEQRKIDTGVSVEIPIGYYGKMESKSGLMFNHGIICMGGVVDSGFRGTIKTRIWNTSDEDYAFEKGDKLVQMVLVPTLLAVPVLQNDLEVSESGRDASGFGSTGR